MSEATVLYLVDGLGLSGKTKAMVDLVCGLDPGRYRAVVACFDAERSPLLEPLQRQSIPLYEIPCPDGLNVGVMVRIAKLMREVRPDVVHCYNPRTMLYGGLVARTMGVKATLGTLSAFACMTPNVHYGFLPQRLFTSSRRNQLRNRVVARLMGALVTVSPSLGEGFCKFNGIDSKRLRVVSYGVDLERFRNVTEADIERFRAKIGVPPDAVAVGSVGRLVEQKDYPTQLRAFARALRDAPSLFMVLAGEGPLRNDLEKLAAELGISERVRFIGHCGEVPLLLRSLDIFVLASKFEPYGVALLEAKAAGVAIAATAVNEIPELIASGESGLLAPPGNPEALAKIFAKLANDADLRRRLGRAAVSDAVARHSLAAAIEAYQEIYDGIRTKTGHLPGRAASAARVS